MFTALEREEPLTRRVTNEVERLIIRDLLRPGDKLPAERELATRFQVSRTVIREAIRSLAARGMVQVRQGSGTTVCTPSLESLTQPLSRLLRSTQPEMDYRKVIEVRRVLEIEIAGYAAERRTEENLRNLHQIVEDRSAAATRKGFIEWDVAFHSGLARATQNELFLVLLDSVAAVMREVRKVGFKVSGTPERAYRYHRRILDEVVKSNSAGAREAMRDHLVESEQTIVKALKPGTKTAL